MVEAVFRLEVNIPLPRLQNWGRRHMKKIISYPISKNSPGWPGNPTYSAEPFTTIAGGAVANTYMLHLFNHFASHLDSPRHFNENGKTVLEMSFDEFFYDRPLLLDIPKKAEELIMPGDLEMYADKIRKADLLLIRTGFEEYRITDPMKYIEHGPGIHSSTAKYLMDTYCGTLKAIGFDFVSLASYSNVEDGDEAHRIMLGKYHNNRYINIIEDLTLKDLKEGAFTKAAAVPLRLEDADSSPVTMWVE